ncbi:IclR family transcriptional regulator [Pseudoroseomonas ludipueritiae]|uniref:IclR family transcriptional regulator n=1 Tax=Pseudoroseomonas ludipueritiae TaxID=198093 RepID=A0ABR7R1K5_9PROT|nr:IclR family transcriptional regulator [Pseudoroseomonas ludipueritiae]MBC9175615.1 IclR family transcriptional regulator [Pseudoroseomonas ludipueritiae]
MNDTVRSAARVLDLLEHLAGRAEGVSLSELAAALALPKSSALMLLRTLAARGYVTRDAADRYALNELFRQHGFGWGGQHHARLMAHARPIMEQLCDEVGETVLLGVAENNSVRSLCKVVSQQMLRYDFDIANRSPLYCTAMGRVLTAFAPADQAEAMLGAAPRIQHTPSTVTDLAALRRIIARIREEEIAVVEEEWVLGGTGVAVPVFLPQGGIAAALDVGCVTQRFLAKRDHLTARLRAAGQRLTQALGTPAPA